MLLVVTAATACGPGRQAAWEKQAGATLAAADDASIEELKAHASAAWAKRDSREAVEGAIAAWERVVAKNVSDTDAFVHLSRAYYFLADGYIRPTGNSSAMIATFEKGILAGEQAMMATSKEFATRVTAGEKVEVAVAAIPKSGQPAIYWYATNLGKFAVAKGFTTTIFYKDRIFAVMQHVLSLDETFFYGAPHRYFGAFYAKAPSFAGGDMTKSKEHFEKAIALEDEYLGTKVLYAEYYAAKADDRDLFTRLLTEVQAGDPEALPDIVPEQLVEKKKAETLLSQADDLF